MLLFQGFYIGWMKRTFVCDDSLPDDTIPNKHFVKRYVYEGFRLGMSVLTTQIVWNHVYLLHCVIPISASYYYSELRIAIAPPSSRVQFLLMESSHRVFGLRIAIGVIGVVWRRDWCVNVGSGLIIIITSLWVRRGQPQEEEVEEGGQVKRKERLDAGLGLRPPAFDPTSLFASVDWALP